MKTYLVTLSGETLANVDCDEVRFFDSFTDFLRKREAGREVILRVWSAPGMVIQLIEGPKGAE